MHVVSLISAKGGVSKSTLATCLAVAAMQAGEQVLALDLDVQGTLSSWAGLRSAETPSVAALPPGSTAQLADLLAGAAARYSIAILDTAGADTPETRNAMNASTLCLVPLRPTRPDGLAIRTTVEALIRGRRPFAFVLTQCPTTASSSRATEMAAGLGSLGLLAEPLIHTRADYQDAFSAGMGVTEYAPAGRAAIEINELWAWIARTLKGSTK